MISKKYDYYCGDFETTVEDDTINQKETAVWSSAIVKLFTNDVKIFGNIFDTFDYFSKQKKDCIVYYHNLKFDGSFYIDYFLRNGFKTALIKDKEGNLEFKKDKYLNNWEFTYLYTDTGLMYSFTFKLNNRLIKLYDSYKLLPFSLDSIGKSFETKHKKLTMDYKGNHYPNCPISETEKKYIKNDVLVLKEALEIMLNDGHDKMTIGSCCMSEYKDILKTGKTCDILGQFLNKYDNLFNQCFPQLYDYLIDSDKYECENAGEYIRKSYAGGWVYLKKGMSCKVINNGATYDVNSEYPSQMHSESGNYYPVGFPNFWKGNFIPKEALRKDRYYFIRFKCNFELKDEFLPFVQIKRDIRYNAREMLETSKIKRKTKDGNIYYSDYYRDYDGNVKQNYVVLTMTMTDYKRFFKHYNVTDFEILDGCWFYAFKGLFDEYIDKWMGVKEKSKGALRQLAKLYLNNLYGKFATYIDSSFKVFYLDNYGNVTHKCVKEKNKKGGYIAIGSAITSYARNFIITHAQENYDTFIYADTDSLHLSTREPININIHPTKLNCWKAESYWDVGWFVRAKTYIEHVTHENEEPCEPYYNVKCAGLPDRPKNLFLLSCGVDTGYNFEKLSKEEKLFLYKKRKITDFKVGIEIPGKLKMKRIKGGIILCDEIYKMR